MPRWLLLIILVTCGAACTTVPKGVPLREIPRKFAPPVTGTDHVINLNQTDDLRVGQRWVVYSDRANNPTYTEAGGTTVKNRLGFLDAFFVIDEVGLYVHLAQGAEIDHLTLSQTYQDVGWIRKERLLLWQQSLVSEHGNINQKAMTLNSVDHLRHASEQDTPYQVRFRQGPEPRALLTNASSELYKFFYVYKQTAEAVLLGNVPRLPRQEKARREAIVGWTPRSRVLFWNHRMALEPNWEQEAVVERRRGQPVKIFANATTARRYSRGDSAEALWDKDPLGSRLDGDQVYYRFPVLNVVDQRAGLFKVGVTASLGDDGQTLYSTLPNRCGKQEWQNVNVVFIVDATSGMARYFPAIVKAIEQSIDRLKELRYTYCFGAVAYRDYAEGPRLLESVPLGDGESVQAFLQQVKAYDEHDTDRPEAVFYGLKGALQNVGLTDNGINVCAVVGDAGNHHRSDPSQVPAEDIVRLLVQRTCHLLAVQVRHGREATYDDFVEQMKALAIDTAQRLQPPERETDTLSWKQRDKVYQLSGPKYESWIVTPRRTSLPPEALERYLGAFMNHLEDLFILQQQYDHPFVDVPMYKSTIYDFLEKTGVSSRRIGLARQRYYQLFTEGLVTLSVKNQQHPLFKRVLLFSRDELALLFANIQQLANVSASNNDRRVLMVRVWKQILQRYLDETYNQLLGTLSMEEIHTRVFGPSGETASFLQNVDLEDIENPYTFSDDDFARYLTVLEESSAALSTILNASFSAYPYQFRSHEEVYYWIDVSILP